MPSDVAVPLGTPPCPECATATARVAAGPPWCPSCEWNLGAFDAGAGALRGWRWIERLGQRLAYRLDRSLYRALSTGASTSRTAATTVLYLFALTLLACDVAMLAGGVALLVLEPHFWSGLLGFVLVGLSVALRPRFGRVPKPVLDPALAPGLHDLVARVAVAAGAPVPDHIVLDRGFNASIGRYGLRGRTVLRIGGTLWLALSPQQRVALLAHELGHLGNGDPNRSQLVAPLLATFGRLGEWTGADRGLRDIASPDRVHPGSGFLGEVVLWFVTRPLVALHLVLCALGQRAQNRGEYLADGVAADVAGTDATVALLDVLLDAAIHRLVEHIAAHTPPARWPATVADQQAARAAGRALRRQESARYASIWASHPPSGRRAQLLLAQVHRAATVRLDAAGAAAVDAELPNWIAAVHADLLGLREYEERRRQPATVRP